MVWSISIRAYSQFTPLLSKVKKIPRDIAKRIDAILQSARSANLSAADIKLNELPDLETISSEHIPTLWFIPVNFRVRRSELLAWVIEALISLARLLEKWKKFFAISNCILRASARGGKKNKQQQEKQLLSRLERWKSGDYAALWYNVASIKQSSKTSNESIDVLTNCAKVYCLQGQLGRAAKVLSSDGVAHDNAARLNGLKKLHPKEK